MCQEGNGSTTRCNEEAQTMHICTYESGRGDVHPSKLESRWYRMACRPCV